MSLRLLVATLLVVLPAVPAAAIEVSGSFSGFAHLSGATLSRAAAGASPVTGVFTLEIPTEPWENGSGVAPPSARIAFALAGQTFSFLAGPDQVDAPGAISVGWGETQSVSFLTSYRPRFDGAILTFGSGEGRLFDPEDFGTLALNDHTVSWMSASFASAANSLVASVDVQSFHFDTPASPVDEPASGWLLLTGFGWLAAWARARRKAPAKITPRAAFQPGRGREPPGITPTLV